MININEIRIGNYVNWSDKKDISNENTPVTICSIEFKGGEFLNGSYQLMIDNSEFDREKGQTRICITEEIFNIKPIFLTEKWLKKFGFILFSSGTLMKRTVFSGPGFMFKFELHKGVYKSFINDIEVQIDYVHQLQNTFYVLSGRELQY